MRENPELDALIEDIVTSFFEMVFRMLSEANENEKKESSPVLRNRGLIRGREEELRAYLKDEIATLSQMEPNVRVGLALASKRYTVAMMLLRE